LIETDRLLELIDQFAAAEGRMKWAPNKKLHFEVAVIKAIQTLGQVTLDQVIQNLSAMREGKTPPEPKPRATTTAPPPPKPAARAATTSSKPAPVRAAEKQANAEPKSAEPELVAPSAPSSSDSADIDAEQLWQKAVDQIRARRPLIKGWIDSAKALGHEGRSFLLGFPPEQKTAMESIAMPRNRDFLESLLKEISGRDWNIKFSLKEGLVVEAPKVEEKETRSAVQKQADTAASFTNDPLIREALEIFKGEIKPVTE
jgi:DNA polymerase-3 subunit gamma/tau